MKKILHIAEPFATGVLTFVEDLVKRQVDEYEVYIAYGIRPLTPPDVECLFDKRVHMIKIDEFKGALGTVFNPKAYKRIRKLCKEIHPDIIHLHSTASGFVGRIALDCSRNNVFYTPNGYSFLMQGGTFLKRKLYWLLEWMCAMTGAKTIACGKGEYEEALKLSKNSTYVNNGINTDGIREYVRDYNPNKKPIKICTSGRILLQKNPSLFNQIAAGLPDVEFIWIGEGELRSELTSKNIKITGWVSRLEALKILEGCDVFLLPSLWEGLPLSLLEAMYLKKLCVVSNVIGNKDVIDSGRNGFICQNLQEFISTLKIITEGEVDGVELSNQAHLDVENNYNLDVMAKEYDKKYNE